ncbi:MAG: septum formation initiator family protein [Oscillospiraceae bacterium]|nr:septum formation initiator family protein [Oscillospiraceae bacterium]
MQKRKKRKLIANIIWIALFVLILFVVANFLINLISFQVQLAADMRELKSIEKIIDARRMENQDLLRIKEQNMDDEYIIKMAREMGYIEPDERVYIDIGSED